MNRPATDRTAWFYALFLLSGASALIYQVLWLRKFTLVLGNSLYSASVVLAAFMCGMALGSWLIGKRSARIADPVRLYALLEAGVGLSALLLTFAIVPLGSLLARVHGASAGSLFQLTLFRLAVAFIVLIVPTSLIGGTLPVITTFLTRKSEQLGRRVGYLYGWNTLGAVAGSLATGFWLLSAFGMNITLYIAVAVSLAAAVGALILRALPGGNFTGRESGEDRRPASGIKQDNPGAQPRNKYILAVAFLNGAVALACEVIWGRFLSFILRNELYGYSLMLAAILLGITPVSYTHLTLPTN